MRIGLGVSEDLTIAQQRDLAVVVERAGLASIVTNEARGRDALLVCQAWADATRSIAVGVGVVPLWTRSAAQLAMAAATLQESSGGRFVLGLGVSHPATMGPWHGADYRRPLTAAAETLEILEQLQAGATSAVDGAVRSSRGFRIALSPRPARATTWLAAMGPRMLALAGRAADGTLLNWSAPEEVERAGATVRAAAAEAGRDAGAAEVAAYVRVAVHDDRDEARAALVRELGAYCALPAYAAHLERQGAGHVVTALKEAHRRGGAAAVPDAVDDDDLRRFGWYGTPDDDPSSALDAYRRAGLDHLVARVVVAGADPVRAVLATARLLGSTDASAEVTD